MLRHIVVVLRFADTTVADIVLADSEAAAVSDFASRALAKGHKLPLLTADTALVPPERMAELLELGVPIPEQYTQRPAVPIRGLLRVVQAYQMAEEEVTARQALDFFFEHYEQKIDYTGAALRNKVSTGRMKLPG